MWITKAESVFSEHAQNHQQGRAPHVDTSTEQQEATMHHQNKMSRVYELGTASEQHARK